MEQRAIYKFNCCTNGRAIGDRKKIPPHYFIILTNTDYNKRKEYVTALPLTSKRSSAADAWFQVLIQSDDVERLNIDLSLFDKQTFVLVDRPCRLKKENLRSVGIVRTQRYHEILDDMAKFLKNS